MEDRIKLLPTIAENYVYLQTILENDRIQPFCRFFQDVQLLGCCIGGNVEKD